MAENGEMTKKQHSTMNRIVRYGVILVWIGIITWSSTNQFSKENTDHFLKPILQNFFHLESPKEIRKALILIRKLAHFTEYAILAIFIVHALYSSQKEWLQKYWVYWSVSIVTIIALFDEYHQSFEITRTGSIIDSLIDMAGGFTYIALYFLFRQYQKNKNKIP